MKTCIKCNQTKDFTLFFKKTSARDGHSSYCKACQKLYEQSDKAKTVRRTYENNKKQKFDNKNIAWQKLQRDKLIAEDKALGFPFNLSASNFILAEEHITKEHREFIQRYEWLGTIGFGVRYVFTARYQNKLAGVVMLAEPNGYQFSKKHEALIQRGACSSWSPKNLNSRLVMFAVKWMAANTTKRIFTAYSDCEAGEIGTIYQACNFDYLGKDFGAREYYLVNGKKQGSRFFTRTSAMKKWARQLNIKWEDGWCKPNGFQDITKIPNDIRQLLNDYAKNEKSKYKKVKAKPKGKYVLLLNYGKEKLKKTWLNQPYPKR